MLFPMFNITSLEKSNGARDFRLNATAEIKGVEFVRCIYELRVFIYIYVCIGDTRRNFDERDYLAFMLSLQMRSVISFPSSKHLYIQLPNRGYSCDLTNLHLCIYIYIYIISKIIFNQREQN